MRTVVVEQFPAFTRNFESDRNFLYADIAGLVTIGLGLLVDPRPLLDAMSIEFEWPDDGPASRADVDRAWTAVKMRKAEGVKGSAHFEGVTVIRATQASLERAAQRKLLLNEAAARKYFPGWDSFPAPGQLLIASMEWAMGAGAFVRWPNFCAAVNRNDWAAVACKRGVRPASCQMDERRENEWFCRRNAANLELANRAVTALAGGGVDDLDVEGVLATARAQRAEALGLPIVDYVLRFET